MLLLSDKIFFKCGTYLTQSILFSYVLQPLSEYDLKQKFKFKYALFLLKNCENRFAVEPDPH